MTMLKYIAVRLKRYQDSKVAFSYKETHQHKRTLIDSNIEKRDPALRNLIAGLADRGMKPSVDDCQTYWFLICDQNPIAYYEEKNEVECVFESEWFEDFKKKIRCHRGASYVEQCLNLAASFSIKDQDRLIDYVV